MKALHELLECGSLVAHDSKFNLFVTVTPTYMRLWKCKYGRFIEVDVKSFALIDNLLLISLKWLQEKAEEMIAEYEEPT